VQLSIFFDLVFTVQHFFLYKGQAAALPEEPLQVGEYQVIPSVDPELGSGPTETK
jgi:hypothetical protein